MELKNSIQPILSIIIPVHNSEKTLKRCIDSIINQTLVDIEIICVNDGSTDDSLNILIDYQKRDSRIKIIDKENGGVSSARNVGIDFSSSDYLAFMDSDDWILPMTYENCVKRIPECDLVSFGS